MKYANNPANIRFVSSNKWLGLVAEPTQRKFCEFTSLEYGLRALLYLLCKYYFRYNLITVPDIINRFAPSSENNTKRYISYVENQVRIFYPFVISPVKTPKHFIWVVAKAICFYESNTVVDLDDLKVIYVNNIPDFAKKLNIQQSRLI